MSFVLYSLGGLREWPGIEALLWARWALPGPPLWRIHLGFRRDSSAPQPSSQGLPVSPKECSW
jgi:hypothetical protein